MMLHLLCNTSAKVNKVEAVADDAAKAKHWQELLTDQGKDITIVILDGDQLEAVQRLLEK